MSHSSSSIEAGLQSGSNKKQAHSPIQTVTKAKQSRRKGRRDSYLRFSPLEQAMLLEGVHRYGAGNWKKILSSFQFHRKRTAVDLKDKYRNILRAQEREKAMEKYKKSYPEAVFRGGKTHANPSPICYDSQLPSIDLHSRPRHPLTRFFPLPPIQTDSSISKKSEVQPDSLLSSLRFAPANVCRVSPISHPVQPAPIHGHFTTPIIPQTAGSAGSSFGTPPTETLPQVKMRAPSPMKLDRLLCAPEPHR